MMQASAASAKIESGGPSQQEGGAGIIEGLLPWQATLATAATGAAVLGTAYWWWRTRTRKSAKPKDRVVLELLPLEKDVVAQKESAISTVTFFRGNYEKAAPILRERALEILRANPWLAGSVGKNTLSFPSAEPEKLPQGSFEVCDGEGGRRAVRLHRHTPYGEICKAVSPLFVQAGKCKLVWRVSIVPDSKDPSARFALITSLSHGAGDGNTYYQIHNMLWGSGSGKVQSLNPVRNFEVHQQTPTTKARNQVFSPSFMLKTAWCIIYGKFFAREKCIVDISILNEVSEAEKEERT